MENVENLKKQPYGRQKTKNMYGKLLQFVYNIHYVNLCPKYLSQKTFKNFVEFAQIIIEGYR